MHPNRFGSWLWAVALSLFFAAGSALPAAAEVDFLAGVGEDSPMTASNQAWGRLEYFSLHEYDGKTTKAKEAGPRLSVGVSRAYNRDDVTFTPRIGGMLGYVDYKGEIGAPYTRPVDTYSKYYGLDLGADVGVIYRLQGEATVEPFFGLGWNWWRRDIASWGGPRETWDTVYARGGARAAADLKAGEKPFRGYGELGLKMPLSTQDSVKIANAGKVNLKPRGSVSAFAEAGIVFNKLKLGVSYDSWRFMNSEPVELPDGTQVSARKSQTDIFALNAGYSF
jgi:hypothetical protein